MKTKVFLSFLSVLVSLGVCSAEETNANARLQSSMSPWVIPETWQPKGLLQEVVSDAVVRFEPLLLDSVYQLKMENPFSSDFRDNARDNLSRAGAHSLRTAVGDNLFWDFGSSRSSGVIAGSIANPEQDIINPTSITPYSYGQSWWNRVRNEPGLLFGIRPFNENPYAYLAKSLKYEGVTIASLNARYYYYEFRSHRVELVALVPLGDDSLSAAFGVSYNSKLNHEGGGVVGTLQLQKVLYLSKRIHIATFTGVRLGALSEQSERWLLQMGASLRF